MTAAMPPPADAAHQRAALLDHPEAAGEIEHAGRHERVVFPEAVARGKCWSRLAVLVARAERHGIDDEEAQAA
jgi:hypothetical protein